MENLVFDFAKDPEEEPEKDSQEEEQENNLQEELPGEPVAISVAQAVELINDQLFQIAGPNLMVEGEISDYSVSQGKWIWFTLKDAEENAVLKCFATTFQIKTPLEEGDKVLVHATPKIFPKSGGLTLNINSVEIIGEGALAIAFERLRKKLESEGLFSEDRKRPIPSMPQEIGLITSRQAAACTDFIRIIKNRWGGVNINLAHVAVQGEKAVESICKAIEYFNAQAEKPEVLVLTRGGGSLEDLSAFNAEEVVRAVFASQIPIVVGIGHERDESLAEFAADKRASTPSNAAEMIVPDKSAVIKEIEMTAQRIGDRLEETLRIRRHETEKLTIKLSRTINKIKFQVESVINTVESMIDVYLNRIEYAKERVKDTERFIKEFNPKRILKRGYSIARIGDKILKDASQVKKGDKINLQLSNGTIESEAI